MGTSAFAQLNVFGVPSDTYGERCTRCRGLFGQGFCQRICCESCQEKNIAAGGDGSSCESSICAEVHAPLQVELNRIQGCMDSDYSMPGCNGMREFLNEEEDLQSLRANQRRADSCDSAVAYAGRDCNLVKLDQGESGNYFNKAKQILSANSCDSLNSVGFDLRAAMEALGDPVIICQDHFKDCKRFCYDENTVQNGGGTTFDDPEDQENYENICSPKYEAIVREANIRRSLFNDADSKASECTERTNPNNPAPLPRADAPNPAPTNPNSVVNNPEVALSRLNALTSLVQPFVTPQTNSNYNPSLYSNGNPGNKIGINSQKSELSYEEKYGPQYQGSDSGGSNDYDYIENTEFDKPDSLKTSPSNAQNANRNNRQGMGAGLGGMMGSGSSGNSNSPTKAGGKSSGKRLKDKSMFGKYAGSTGGSGLVESESNKKSKNGFSTSSKGGLAGNKNPKFNASKYHAQIMAAYNKGNSSRAQVMALRRAAGLKVETFDEKRKKGYTDWHAEHKIHPENISLFMQARICYNTKFRSDFAESCEFK